MVSFSRIAAAILLLPYSRVVLADEYCTDGIRVGSVCCAGGCGQCGGSGCSQRPGGEDMCCTSNIKDEGRSCQDAGDVACLIPSTPKYCADGTPNKNVCCAGVCGRCGGSGCGQLPGGADKCCTSNIKDEGRSCQDAGDVACLIPSTPQYCADGIPNKNVCCAGGCGRCGGSGCGQLPGGADMCCTSNIKDEGRSCQDAGDVACLIPAEGGPTSKPELEVQVKPDIIRRTASLVGSLDPAIAGLLEEAENNPEDEVRNDELRDKVQEAWASNGGKDLAQSLEDSNDPTYLEIKNALMPTLSYFCTEFADKAQFSKAVKDCMCRRDTTTPIVFCAARIDQEIKDAMIAPRGNLRRREQLAKCELDKPGVDKNDPALSFKRVNDVFAIFHSVLGGDPFCLGLECSVPFPPPLSFLAFKGSAGGCLPGIKLGSTIAICQDSNDIDTCDTVESLKESGESFGNDVYINTFTDPRVYLTGKICLNIDDKHKEITEGIIPLLAFLGIPSCFVSLDLNFYFLMGYLNFGAKVQLSIFQATFNVELQFYDDIREEADVCSLLKNGQCGNQTAPDEGQNSCSLCKGTDRYRFAAHIQLTIASTIKTDKAGEQSYNLGNGASGQCLGEGEVIVEEGTPPSYVDLWKKVGYRERGILPGDSDIACRISAAQMQSAFNVIPNDNDDDSQGIQDAIDKIDEMCPGRSYTSLALIELPAGFININREIHVDVSFLVIRGQGNTPNSASSTIIQFEPGPDTVYDEIRDFELNDMKGAGTATGGWIWPGRGAFRVQTRAVDKRYDNDYEAAPANRKDFFEGSVNFHWRSGILLKDDAKFGQRTLHLESTERVTVGGYVSLLVANSHGMYNRQGVKKEDRIRGHMRQQIFKVTSINGDSVTLDKPLEFDAFKDAEADGSSSLCGSSKSASQTKVVPLTVVEGVGFEHFYLTQIVPGHDPSEATHNYNNIVKEQAMHGIVFKWAVNSYVQHVRTYMTGSHPIVTEAAKNLQFQNNWLEGSWNKGKGGNGYFRNSKVWDSLIQDNTSIGLRHLTLQWSASGNVVRRNTLDSDLNLHGGWERHNLIEQNIVNIPVGHRDCSPNCAPGDETWYPIWWAAGDHAGGWSGATGPRNVFFNNVLRKQMTPGGAFLDYAPYGTSPQTIFQFGWNSDNGGAGSQWKHLTYADGESYIESWTKNELFDFSPSYGVNALCSYQGTSLLDATVEQCDAW